MKYDPYTEPERMAIQEFDGGLTRKEAERRSHVRETERKWTEEMERCVEGGSLFL